MTIPGHILVPSAATIPPEMALEFGHLPSTMVPLRGQPALEHITRPLIKRGWSALVGYSAQGSIILDYLSAINDGNILPVSCRHSRSLGESILALLDAVSEQSGPVLINYGDTLIGDMEDPASPLSGMIGKDFIAYNQIDETWRWTSFSLSPSGRIKSVQDKLIAPTQGGMTTVFVGLFGISDSTAFKNILKTCIDQMTDDKNDPDPFYSAICQWFNSLSPDPSRFINCQHWNDLGHIDNYNTARRNTFMNQRFFNNIQIDDSRGILTKTSQNESKFLNEINWYLNLPPSLAHIAPRIFNYSLDVGTPFVEMEFYGYPVLSDLFLYSTLDPGVWERIFSALHQLLNQFAEHRFIPDENTRVPDILRAIYVSKSIERMALLGNDRQFDVFLRDDLQINGQPVMSLTDIQTQLPALVEDILIRPSADLCVIHGDLCLGNILYDRRNGIVRAVDPRGDFGGLNIYGDQIYDLAKLRHSFIGHFDHMVNDRFELSCNGNAITWSATTTQTQNIVSDMFGHFLDRYYKDKLQQIRLAESLLFLSMPPLHKDRPHAQMSMLARGISLFTSIFENHTSRKPTS